MFQSLISLMLSSIFVWPDTIEQSFYPEKYFARVYGRFLHIYDDKTVTYKEQTLPKQYTLGV